MNAQRHLAELALALESLAQQEPVLLRWGHHLAGLLSAGGRLLAAGNGGSAAQAQHLTAEIVGRYARDREPFSSIALHAETSSLTAIVNDYGPGEMFARQLQAHGRQGDVCVLMSTSGSSANLLTTARRARDVNVTTWALTGPAPNPLATLCDEYVYVNAPTTAAIQEVHLVALHLLCEALDAQLLDGVADRPIEAVAS